MLPIHESGPSLFDKPEAAWGITVSAPQGRRRSLRAAGAHALGIQRGGGDHECDSGEVRDEEAGRPAHGEFLESGVARR
jgi:hypothetical protein